MAGWRRWIALGVWIAVAVTPARMARASADIRLDKDFIGGIIEKLPPVNFEKPGQYRGIVHGFQLIGIDARMRQLLVGCKIDGEFHAPVNGPITDRVVRSRQTPEGWRKFGFDVRGGSTSSRAEMPPLGSASRSIR